MKLARYTAQLFTRATKPIVTLKYGGSAEELGGSAEFTPILPSVCSS